MNKRTFIASLLVASLALSACGLSTDQLSTQVQKNMTEQFTPKGISIESLVLTKKQGNEYDGVLKTKEPNGEFTYSVQVIYDGNNMTWKIVQ